MSKKPDKPDSKKKEKGICDTVSVPHPRGCFPDGTPTMFPQNCRNWHLVKETK